MIEMKIENFRKQAMEQVTQAFSWDCTANIGIKLVSSCRFKGTLQAHIKVTGENSMYLDDLKRVTGLSHIRINQDRSIEFTIVLLQENK